MDKTKIDLASLAETVITLFPKLDAIEQRIGLALYRLLAQGNPVQQETLVQTAGLSLNTIDEILRKWPGVDIDGEGRVVGFLGLALSQMDHCFEVEGKTLYTWCAWDSLFIPQILGKTAKVKSICPVTGQDIRLAVTPDRVKTLAPTETVMSFITPEATKILDDVVHHFCCYIHFFASADAGYRWTSENEGTFILSVNEAYRLGQSKNQARYGRFLNERDTYNYQ